MITFDEYLEQQSPGNSKAIKIGLFIAFFALIFCIIVSINNFKKKRRTRENDQEPAEVNTFVFYLIALGCLYLLYKYFMVPFWGFGLYLIMVYGVVLFLG